MTKELIAWDKELETSDLNTAPPLLMRMNEFYAKQPNNIEIVWRWCKALFWEALNFENEDKIREKTMEALRVGQRALEIEKEHYSANLWVANCSGKLVLLEQDVQNKFQYMKIFMNAYHVLQKINKEDPLYYFIGARVQMALFQLSPEERKLIEDGIAPTKLPQTDLAQAEQMLLKSIEIHHLFLDAYHTLVYLYAKTGRIKDALKCIHTALTIVPVRNASQRALWNELNNVQCILEKELQDQQNKQQPIQP